MLWAARSAPALREEKSVDMAQGHQLNEGAAPRSGRRPRASEDATGRRRPLKEEQPSSRPRELSARAEQLPGEPPIDQNQPGTILRDFQTFVDFVGTDGLRTAGQHHLLPHTCLAELNGRMGRPLDVRLRRPQQRSYPNLEGLYLVGRASGLIQARGLGAKGRLVVDEAMRGSWDGLNATERYFTLLEAWLVHTRPGMLGKGRGPGREVLEDCAMLWQSIPKKGLRLERRRPNERYLPGIGTEFQHLALMAMFGLAAVDKGAAVEGQPWRPTEVKRLPWGDAVFALVSDPDVWMEVMTEAEPGKGVFGRLQGVFGPFFPEWRRNLVVSGPVFRKGVFVFGVSLGNVRRRIALSAKGSLEDLAHGILNAFDFDADHLYGFTYKDRFGATVDVSHPYCDEPPWTPDVRVGDLPLTEGEAMDFLYDFGDNWLFRVRLDRVDPPAAGFSRPVVLEAHGKAPPQYGREDW